jgi:hypothetical protein
VVNVVVVIVATVGTVRGKRAPRVLVVGLDGGARDAGPDGVFRREVAGEWDRCPTLVVCGGPVKAGERGHSHAVKRWRGGHVENEVATFRILFEMPCLAECRQQKWLIFRRYKGPLRA